MACTMYELTGFRGRPTPLPCGQHIPDLAALGIRNRGQSIRVDRTVALCTAVSYGAPQKWIFCGSGTETWVPDLGEFKDRVWSIYWARS
jgi:hypothetical protein